MASQFHHDDDDDDKAEASGRLYKDWDCPHCNANNPADQPLVTDDEVLCNYCGSEFKAKITDEGRLKFKER